MCDDPYTIEQTPPRSHPILIARYYFNLLDMLYDTKQRPSNPDIYKKTKNKASALLLHCNRKVEL